MDMSFSLERIKRWGIKGGLSVLDQGVYSGGNFISVLLLARWQQPQEYGGFSVAFAAFLFLSGIYNGLVLEPISILGPSRYAENKEGYLANQMWIHFWVTFPLALILGFCGMLLQNPLLRRAFLGASLALPLMLLTWLARRIYYSNHQPAGAFICSLLYSSVLLMGILYIWKSGNITVAMIFVIMAVAGVAGGITIFWREIQNRRNHNFSMEIALEVMRAHWDLGKWIVFGAFFLLVAELVPVLFITALRGLDEAAAFRAVQNFIQPMVQVETALSLAGMPVLAREFGAKNRSAFRRTGSILVISMTGLAIIYEIVIWFARNNLEHFAYNGRYAMYSNLIPLYGVVPIFIGLFSGYSLSLRVIQKARIYLMSGFIPFALGVPVCYLLTKLYGVSGAISGVIVMHVIIFIVNIYLYYHWIPKTDFNGELL